MSENRVKKLQDKPILFMTVGLPGSGKSTYAKQIEVEQMDGTITRPVIHSSDALRKEMFGDEAIQGDNGKLFNELHSRIKCDLAAGKDVVYDATCLKKKTRRQFLLELKNIDCVKYCICFATTFEACLHNNNQRSRKVPVDVIKRMQMSFAPPDFNEGFDWMQFVFSYLDEHGNIYHSPPQNEFDLLSFFHKANPFNQDNKHHTLSLGDHSIAAYEFVKKWRPDDTALQLAALLHDNGKLYTKTRLNSKGEFDGDYHYYNHQNVGAYNAMFYIDKLGAHRDMVRIINLIYYHMAPYMEWKQSEKARKRDYDLLGADMFNDVMFLHTADEQAH
jgi:predicted kinase